jgi:hypothetical protein
VATKKNQKPSVPESVVKKRVRQKFIAKNVIDYISTNHGRYAHVEPGDVFDDMNTVAVRHELEHGNIEEYVEGGENQ